MQINKHKRINAVVISFFLTQHIFVFSKIISGTFVSNFDSNLGFLFSWSDIYIDVEHVEF